MKKVLFACIHNAGRSQMAAALFNVLADPDKARGISAGTQPGEHVHPIVVIVMQELGIDLTKGRPRLLTQQVAGEASLLITMGCGEACPVVPGLKREDWPLEDPKNKPIERVREIREEIRQKIEILVTVNGWERTSNAAKQ
jgi:arsenate reductase